MPSMQDLFPTRMARETAHRPLMAFAAFAAIVAVSLLSFYVHLLHESLALGEQMRERQRSTATPGAMKAATEQRSLMRGSAARGSGFNGMKP